MNRLLQPVLIAALAVPALRLGVLAWQGTLGANPVEALTRSTGWWTLTLLCLTLCATPLRWITGAAWPIRIRRTLGLACFAYACLHLLSYAWFDQWFDLAGIVRDVLRRPFITLGMLSFVLLVPLAFTSTRRMQRRLGRRWGLLHRLVYLIAVTALLHFWWHKAGKQDFVEVSVFAAVVALLLGVRIWHRFLRAHLPAVRGRFGGGAR